MYSKTKFSLHTNVTFVVLAVLLCFSSAWAQDQPHLAGRSEDAINLPGAALGIDIDFSKKTDGTWQGDVDIPMQQLRAFVDATMKSWKVPGLAMAIVKDGEVIFSEGFGLRHIEAKLPVTPNTLFAIGSCSKALTGYSLKFSTAKDKGVTAATFIQPNGNFMATRKSRWGEG